jgi:hypothetical protein
MKVMQKAFWLLTTIIPQVNESLLPRRRRSPIGVSWDGADGVAGTPESDGCCGVAEPPGEVRLRVVLQTVKALNGPSSTRRRTVRIITHAPQIIACRCGPSPQDTESVDCSSGKVPALRVGDAFAYSRRQAVMQFEEKPAEFLAPFCPFCWLVWDPLDKEGNSRRADVVYGLGGHLRLEFGTFPGPKDLHPVAEAVSAIGWLRRTWLVCDERKDHQQEHHEGASAADEKPSLLSHGETMPLANARERAN